MEDQPQPFKPLLSIWLKPRETIRKIVDTDPTSYVILLAMLNYIIGELNSASKNNMGDHLPLWEGLIVYVILGAIEGVIRLYLGGICLRWVGSKLGGQATSGEVRAAIAWSLVPSIVASFFLIPELLIFGEEMFKSSTPVMNSSFFWGICSIVFFIIKLILAIWACVLSIVCLSEVHRFSKWKAFATYIIGFLIIFLPILCIIFGVKGITSLYK